MENNEIESYVKAGKIAQEVKKFARNLIKPGMLLIDIANGIDDKIFELGAEPAFPVNLSLNEVAAHYTPAPGDETIAEGILKVDVGVAINGYIADTAFSVDLTEDGEYEEMMALNEEILAEATKVIKVGMEVRDIGNSASETLDKWSQRDDSGEPKHKNNKYSIIKNLCGHSLAQGSIHAGLTISNYKNDNRTKLDESAFAVEPFVTTGVGDIYEGPVGGIYVVQSDDQVRDRDARDILNFIKDKFGTLPFCARWLEDEGLKKIRFSLSLLARQGILHHYPQLIEKSRKPVSQFENTFVISGDRVICTTG